MYALPNFWLAQIIPLFALLGFIAWRVRQIRSDDREAQRIAALHQEATELMRKLRRDHASPGQYYLNASRAVQVKTALAKNVEPNVVDVEMAGAAFQLDENSRRQLRQLFARSDELRYSGAQNGGHSISPENRRQVLELIEHLRT
jgi:phosphoglucomutase